MFSFSAIYDVAILCAGAVVLFILTRHIITIIFVVNVNFQIEKRIFESGEIQRMGSKLFYVGLFLFSFFDIGYSMRASGTAIENKYVTIRFGALVPRAEYKI